METVPPMLNCQSHNLRPYEERHQHEEASLPGDGARTGVVIAFEEKTTASEEKAKVVGPVVMMDADIEGVPIRAMIDTGAQSTIISRATLHAVVQHLRSNN